MRRALQWKKIQIKVDGSVIDGKRGRRSWESMYVQLNVRVDTDVLRILKEKIKSTSASIGKADKLLYRLWKNLQEKGTNGYLIVVFQY